MPAELPSPDVLSMVLADGVHRDSATGKFFILGTYKVIASATFPITLPAIVVYLELTDGRGQTALRMRLVDVDETREPVFESDAAVEFADPTDVREIVFFVPEVVIPEPGEYRLQLFGNEKFMRERRLLVVPVDSESEENP